MFENLKRYLPKNGKITVIENIVDPEVQIEYFELANKLRDKKNIDEAKKQAQKLLDNQTDINLKKRLLVLLPAIKDVKIFRIIEKYAQNPDEQLKDWAALAKYESQNTLKNYLLNENYTLISAGLGGKDDKLRFIIILVAKDKKNFTDFERERLKREILFACKNKPCELEKINFSNYFATIIGLFPLDSTLEDIFDKIIDNINLFGNFIDEHYIVSNIKQYSETEIIELIENMQYKLKNPLDRDDDFGEFGDIPEIDDDDDENDDDDDEDNDIDDFPNNDIDDYF